MELSELKELFIAAKEKDLGIRGTFDLDKKSKQLEELKKQSSAQGFWDNSQSASNIKEYFNN